MKPRLEDLTLREKIGQTAIFRFDTLREIDDFKKYFKENPVGASWSMVNRPDIYERLAELLGKDYSETYVDDKYKDYLNTNAINAFLDSHTSLQIDDTTLEQSLTELTFVYILIRYWMQNEV